METGLEHLPLAPEKKEVNSEAASEAERTHLRSLGVGPACLDRQPLDPEAAVHKAGVRLQAAERRHMGQNSLHCTCHIPGPYSTAQRGPDSRGTLPRRAAVERERTTLSDVAKLMPAAILKN